MARYEVRFKKSITKDLRRIPNRDVQRILNRIDKLAEKPRDEGCIKLSGNNRFRLRLGLYRIIYEIIDKLLIIEVVKIGHRSSVYKNN